MTVTELTQLQYLGSEISQIDIRIKEAKAEAEGKTSGGITGMPFGAGTPDKVGNGASKISDLINRLEKTKAECWNEINRLMTYIGTIEESETRQIMSLRYINGFTFQKIAFAIGGWDESVPRKKHNKYLELSELSESNGDIV